MGFIPVAPGTFGTLEAFPVFWLLRMYFTSWALFGIIVVLYLAGIFICDRASRLSGIKDPAFVIWDEIICFLLVLLCSPVTWFWQLLAFALFRFFDIVKPGPIGYVDKKLGGGFGIMFDDFLASVATILILQFLAVFIVRM